MPEGSASSPFHTPMFRAVILQGRRKKRRRSFGGEIYKKCNRVERLVGGLKQFRRVVTRYEKTAESYPAMLTLTAILLLWLWLCKQTLARQELLELLLERLWRGLLNPRVARLER